MIARFRLAFVGQASSERAGNRLSQRWAFVRANEKPHERVIVVDWMNQQKKMLSWSEALLTVFQAACR